MKTINWTTSTGTAIEVTISVDFRLDRQGRRYTSGEKQVVIQGAVNGERHFAPLGIQSVTGHATCIAKLGNIGITADNLAKINEAIEAAKIEIAPHNAALDAHAAKLDLLGNGDINAMFGSDA